MLRLPPTLRLANRVRAAVRDDREPRRTISALDRDSAVAPTAVRRHYAGRRPKFDNRLLCARRGPNALLLGYQSSLAAASVQRFGQRPVTDVIGGLWRGARRVARRAGRRELAGRFVGLALNRCPGEHARALV